MEQKRTFIERFTSRPFLAAVAGFLSSFGAAMTVLSPDVPTEKVNAIVGLALAGIGALSVFIHGELKSDREVTIAKTRAVAQTSTGVQASDNASSVDNNGQVISSIEEIRSLSE